MRCLMRAAAGAVLLLVWSAGFAQSNTAQEVAELRAQLAAIMARLERLESDVTSAPTAPTPAAQPVAVAAVPGAASWTDSVKLGGDLRYRHEAINDAAEVFHNRHRVRARVNIAADIADNMTAGFGLSSGGPTNDSGNQTLGDGWSYKQVDIDLAYFNWGITDGLNLIAGKMANPFFRPDGYHLIYDSDMRPEGLALKYTRGSFFGNLSTFWVEERSSDADSMLVGLQGGYRTTLDNGVRLTGGASYYNTSHAQGQLPFFTPNSGQGNQLDANGGYLYGFREIELFAEARFNAGREPLTVFADLVKNQDADAFDQGYALGVSYRDAANPGDWSIGYVYQDLEANAVIGAFTDSDFAGGTSDGSGHSILAEYVFPGRWNFGLRYIIGERGEAAGNLRDYNRLQADISMRY